MTTASSTTSDLAAAPARAVPRFGGLNGTLLRIELRRVLRNRRQVVFTVVMPVVFYLLFGKGQSYSNQSAGHGNVTAYVMISMAVYGAMIATAGAGAAVATERAQGWSRQLRLTPLTPGAYVVAKILVAMVTGAVATAVVFVAGLSTGAHVDSVGIIVATALLSWLGSLVFAAFGLFMGYLVPSENVMQFIGPGLALLSFLGGLFVPLQDGSTFEVIARFTPLYGIAKVARAPLTGDPVQWWWVLNIVVWLAVFAGGAAWRMRRDTARV